LTSLKEKLIKIGAVWGLRQAWNFPFGRGAKGEKFV